MSPTTTNNAEAVQWGRLESQQEEDRERKAASGDPGAFHGDIAASELHWFDADSGRWLRRDPDSESWSGFDAKTGETIDDPGVDQAWRPWKKAFDDSDAPFYRWFTGGLTNACFNEVDRHVLGGRGRHAAFVF